MPEQRWRCWDCGKTYTSTIQIREVVHRCKDRRNVPMKLDTSDEQENE